MDIQFSNRPDTDLEGYYWNTFAEGDANNVLIRRGDLVTRNATQNQRLAKGIEGTFLKAGATDLEWGKVGAIINQQLLWLKLVFTLKCSRSAYLSTHH